MQLSASGHLENLKMTKWNLISGLLLCFMGCAPAQPTGDVIDTVPASGVLTHKGAPLEFYRVSFFPKENRPAMGETNAVGKFTLGTNKPDDGAVVGNTITGYSKSGSDGIFYIRQKDKISIKSYTAHINVV